MVRTAVFRCDASPAIGFGHLERSLALAAQLRSRSWNVVFAMSQDAWGAARAESHGFQVRMSPANAIADAEGAWLDDVVMTHAASALILDVRSDLPIDAIRRIRSRDVFVATIDDPTERRREADAAFYPPVPQVLGLDWGGFTGELCTGWEWVVLRPEFAAARAKRLARDDLAPSVLVTAGGSDPKAITLAVLEALDQVDRGFKTQVVLGAAFQHDVALEAFRRRARRQFEIKRDVREMWTLMSTAHLAVASFGVTAYELAAMGVPAIHLCLTKDHVRSAESLSEIGAAINLGLCDMVSTATLAATVSDLLGDSARLRRMANQGMSSLDGLGAERIAEFIDQRTSKPN